MKYSLLNDNEEINFSNFYGPGTDLIISLVALLLVMIIAITDFYKKELDRFTGKAKEELIGMKRVHDNQYEVLNEISIRCSSKPEKISENRELYKIINENSKCNIVILNDATIQRISFGSQILFDTDKADLKDDGRVILKIAGEIIKKRLPFIKEIQIQGHADLRSSALYNSNIELAVDRALSVFRFFEFDIGIDPIENIMSITSFGEYMPVQRTDLYQTNYSVEKLKIDNNSIEKQDRNRRIEVILIYNRNQGDKIMDIYEAKYAKIRYFQYGKAGIYKGETVNGIPHGLGIFYYDDYRYGRYEGRFKNGERNGEGKSCYSNGKIEYRIYRNGIDIRDEK